MKIAIDVSQIIYETGVSEYTRDLVAGLLAVDDENEYLLYGGSLRKISNIKNQTAKFTGNYKTKIFPIPPTLADILWNRLHILRVERLIGKVDVLHTSDWSEPPAKAFKVTTVHDLAPFKFPELTHSKIISVHKRKLAWVKKETDRIIVPSLVTKKDLIDMGFDEEKIRIIPEAPDSIFKPATGEAIEIIKKKYRLNGNYLISVGVGGRKNTEKLIAAFTVLKGKRLNLVFVGRGNKFKEQRGVRFLGHVPRQDLPALYSGAEALVYPSLYEGFGLPILESMACGTAVVTSNLSSMPEVAGHAAVLVNPEDVHSITLGIAKALENRKELMRKGLERAKEFSWEKTAQMTLAVYREAASSAYNEALSKT